MTSQVVQQLRNYSHTLPTDCACIIFAWLQPSEAILLSRTSLGWYAISQKKQAYQPLPLPSFNKDDFDLLAYERWKNERDPFLWTPKQLVQCSTSRVMQHQRDIVLVINTCDFGLIGRFCGLDGVSESNFQIGLERFHSVRCLTIQFRHERRWGCRCYEDPYDFYLSDGIVAAITRVIRTWSQTLISFQIGRSGGALQVFDALAAQSLSIPHLQHAIVSDEQLDACAVLAHGFPVASTPPAASHSHPSPTAESSDPTARQIMESSDQFGGGVLELVHCDHLSFREKEKFRDQSLLHRDPHYFDQLRNRPYHLLIPQRYVAWCSGLAPDLTRIHTLGREWKSNDDGQDAWDAEVDGFAAVDAKIQRCELFWLNYTHSDRVSTPDLSSLLRISSSFKSLIFQLESFTDEFIDQCLQELQRLVSKHHPFASNQLHPFASLQSVTFNLDPPFRSFPSRHPSPHILPIHHLNDRRLFPALNELHLCLSLRMVDITDAAAIGGNLSACTWLHHLTISLKSESTRDVEHDSLHLRAIVLGLPQLEHLTLITNFDLLSNLVMGRTTLLCTLLDYLVLANPYLCQVTLRDQAMHSDYSYSRWFQSVDDLKTFQTGLIYLHLLWQKLVPSHPIPHIPSLHPLTRTEILPLHLPFYSRGHRQLRLIEYYQDHDRRHSYWMIDQRPWELRVIQGVSGWVHRLMARARGRPTEDELRLQERRVEVEEYLERESHGLNDRIQSLLQSSGRTAIQPRHSYFRLRLFGATNEETC